MADALISLIGSILGNRAALALIVGVAIVYAVSCRVHPYRACKACRRSKESHSTLFKGAFGGCRACGGRGHHLRLGARILGKKL